MTPVQLQTGQSITGSIGILHEEKGTGPEEEEGCEGLVGSSVPDGGSGAATDNEAPHLIKM